MVAQIGSLRPEAHGHIVEAVVTMLRGNRGR